MRLKIPLIVWGAHQGVDQVGMFSHLDEVEMTRKYRKEHDLMGYEAEDLVDDFDDINETDVIPFRYPDNRELEQVGVRGIYLNNYIRWDSRTQHEEMIKLYGYETAPQTRTFDKYNDIDCWNYSDVHDYIKWLKHGYGKVVDHVCRDIRLGHMSRGEGARKILDYLAKQPKNLKLFLDWIGITENAFHYLIDQHRNPKIWNRNDQWEWQNFSDFSNKLNDFKNDIYLEERFREFIGTITGKCTDSEDNYILIGKGYS